MKKTVVDLSKETVTERDLTPEEIKAFEQRKVRTEHRLIEEQEKQAKLESAKAKLASLGLDEAEVNAILGL